jgi:hypothetical protein
MKTNADFILMWLTVAAIFCQSDSRATAQAPTPTVQRTPTDRNANSESGNSQPKVVKKFNKDGSLHQITGKAKVLDAHVIASDDGTTVDLNRKETFPFRPIHECENRVPL